MLKNLIAKLSELINLVSETEILEFKEAKNNYDFDKLGKYFSALSNEANLSNVSEAWLIFGVNDKRNIIGTQFRSNPADLQSLKAEIANHTTNRITFIEIHEVMTDSGRVIMFQIPPAPNCLPIAWKSHFYGRLAPKIHAEYFAKQIAQMRIMHGKKLALAALNKL